MKVWSSMTLLALPAIVVAFYNCGEVASFLIKDPFRSPPFVSGGALSLCTLKLDASTASETNAEYDEDKNFYENFDPSDYEECNKGSHNSHDDKYTRDIAVDNSDVDLETVNGLLTRRSEMKKTRQFDEADKIRDELLENHGILVRDNDKKWRSGCSESQHHSKWLHGDNLKPRGNFKSRDDFGPNGHDYVLAKDAGPNISSISEEKIHELLAKRLSCKFDRDYDGADAIQAKLLSAGVVIDGKAREWRADGKYFLRYAPREYKMIPHNDGVSRDLKEVEDLVKERSLCRAERLFKRSDEIREELLERFDVRINDKIRLWCVGENHSWGKKYQPYAMSDRCRVPINVRDIEKLVEERSIARGNRDFVKADAIRSQLSAKNVIVDDKKRLWYVGKVSNDRARNVMNSRDRSPYIRRGGGDLSAEKLDLIQSFINKRDRYKQKKQFNDADTIRSRLLNEYGVQVDDGNRQWYIISTEYCMAHDSAEIDAKTQKMVQMKIQDRTLARGEKDYKKADAIKNILFKKYNVVIDDRMKEWSVIDRIN